MNFDFMLEMENGQLIEAAFFLFIFIVPLNIYKTTKNEGIKLAVGFILLLVAIIEIFIFYNRFFN